jgi:hypothetical protein
MPFLSFTSNNMTSFIKYQLLQNGITIAAALPTMTRRIWNCRSWVQIPPGPFLHVIGLRYYFELVLGGVGQIQQQLH